jgi:hypothetical protein
MNLNDVITLLWSLARQYWTPGEASLLLAVLACNLQGTAPTLLMLDALQISPRSRRDARADLIARGALVAGQRGKLALPAFKSLLLPGEKPPNGGDDSPPSGGDSPKSGGVSPSNGDVSPSPSRAAFAVKDLTEKTSSSALTADLKQSVNPSPGRARELADFALHVCKIDGDDDDAIFSILEKHGDVLTCQVLEQYQHNYTRRARQAQRPMGQLLAWCKNPALMDPLPIHAITVATWLARRAAITDNRQTSTGLPSNAPSPAAVEQARISKTKKAAEDKAKAEKWAAKVEPLADRFAARPIIEQDAAVDLWRKSRMFTNQLDSILGGCWLKVGRPSWRGIDVFSGAVRDALAIAESYLTGTPGKF